MLRRPRQSRGARSSLARPCVTRSVTIGSERDDQDTTGHDTIIEAYLAWSADFRRKIASSKESPIRFSRPPPSTTRPSLPPSLARFASELWRGKPRLRKRTSLALASARQGRGAHNRTSLVLASARQARGAQASITRTRFGAAGPRGTTVHHSRLLQRGRSAGAQFRRII